ncbi:hypothetical protein TTHERM_00384870 (macronuclear) [Tetrahymena thermophila SB210]|uniref:Uncharacterized protein n=1 Tax=Tetrahymena thermophila (strain SB210) TaxID=312017 RepID=Q23RK5_TETTS|nr:hypothetical protein TTHERM_00384870 [Tetrahymena thermophila SB210]EAR99043.1 hypothetical protein TTHERM_00384870 [Tetrahymena thermophila SB210]|eukprot:XP_001019288.1 hypothetical protein TTHERM_00384870 [Tetrahymena thermophila SB210]
MKQRQINNYQAQQEILPLKQLDTSFQNQKHQQFQQNSNIVIQPQSNIHSHRVLEDQNKQINYFINQEENTTAKAAQQNNLQDSKPLILRVKRYKKKLQSVLGNYQPIQYSPKSVLRKDIMFPKLCEDKQKRKFPNVSNLSIKVDDREDTPPLQNINNNHNLVLYQNSNKVYSSIDQKSLLRDADDHKINYKQELENQSLYLHEIINNKNDKLDTQLKNQNVQKKESLQVVKQQKQPLESYSQFNSIDVQNNSFIQRNARAISQIEHNRKGQSNNGYQAEPIYQQSSKQRYQKLIPQLSSHRESISIDYQQNQTPKQKQIYTSIRHYYPQSSKNSQISIDFEEYFPYKNAQHNSLSGSPNSSSLQLNTLRSSKQSFILPPSGQNNQIKNIQNTGNFPINNKEQSARSTRQSKNNGISAICDSVTSSMQTIPHEDLESSQNKLRSIQVNIFQNQGLKVNKRPQNMQQNKTNQKQLLDSVELLRKKTQNQNKVSLDYQYLEDFTVFPDNATFQQQQSEVINSSRSRQNHQNKNSGKRSGAGQSLPPSSQLNIDTNQQRKSVMSKISNYPNSKKTEINTNDETDLNKIWNKAQLTNNNSPQNEKVQMVNQSLDLQKGHQNNTNHTILSTIQSNITSYDEEIKKITQLQQKNYHDLQNYVNIHLDLINIKTQIRIKSSLAGNNLKNNNQT